MFLQHITRKVVFIATTANATQMVLLYDLDYTTLFIVIKGALNIFLVATKITQVTIVDCVAFVDFYIV
ncbi:hypothetical protein LJB85_04095 [Porphyromonadaceae bacterium OttesenSCG-928-L07]|nr:hypothetical protein [Porphyromonadaceae bacterium OttesenSCG-928-L07]